MVKFGIFSSGIIPVIYKVIPGLIFVLKESIRTYKQGR
jgi:hypothetical protein